MSLRLDCPCGETLRAGTEEKMVRTAREHLAAQHPERAAEYTDDDILFLSSGVRPWLRSKSQAEKC